MEKQQHENDKYKLSLWYTYQWNNCASILFESKFECICVCNTHIHTVWQKRQQISAHRLLERLVCGQTWTRANIAKWIELWQQQKYTERKICVLKFISIYQPISYDPLQKHLLTVSLSIHVSLSLSVLSSRNHFMQLAFCKIGLVLIFSSHLDHMHPDLIPKWCPHSNNREHANIKTEWKWKWNTSIEQLLLFIPGVVEM